MLLANPKLFTLAAMAEERERLRHERIALVMTNGCFDLLHTGHIYFLQQARRLGDRLVVALNSDFSVKALKGLKRPVQSEKERAFGLAALECVDYVVIFSRPHLEEEIIAIRPDVYTKAGDYDMAKLHVGEKAALNKVDAKIQFLPFLAGFSTTSLIRAIVQAEGDK
ncbi:MAG TPA: adenylyltransferase/cytidyltransferase family protein [Lacunisphaera sp.]|jgi:rfaE bifunctional protein nucleotidyltransferase chain/domain|nr:adenylyltransferase/cytidyltransferase family protein [Lacunisphaera sp.]